MNPIRLDASPSNTGCDSIFRATPANTLKTGFPSFFRTEKLCHYYEVELFHWQSVAGASGPSNTDLSLLKSCMMLWRNADKHKNKQDQMFQKQKTVSKYNSEKIHLLPTK